METVFIVQTYSVNRRRRVEADQPRQVQSAAAAIRMAERLSETKFGVLAFSQSGDPETGDYEEPRLLYQFGDFSREDAEALRFAA